MSSISWSLRSILTGLLCLEVWLELPKARNPGLDERGRN
jgi:hypothetical protein